MTRSSVNDEQEKETRWRRKPRYFHGRASGMHHSNMSLTIVEGNFDPIIHTWYGNGLTPDVTTSLLKVEMMMVNAYKPYNACLSPTKEL